jgi:hypothetical protein
LIGLEEGFIKIVEFTVRDEKIKSIPDYKKLEQKPVVSIIAADKRYYNQRNICFILLQDSKVFIFNYLTR